ncbi:MAG TPA: PHP domain-containing protein [Bacillota bacterium]|nr:PHP domain-containing protein [Bacillota bacterium]
MAGRADLHVHTTASDGIASPAEAVRLALDCGLVALGIADHDTTAGVAPAALAARGTGLEVIPGVEINTDHAAGEVHILGYFYRLQDPQLERQLSRLRERRLVRMETMVGRLQALGLQVTRERVLAIAGSAALGRPHVARALVESGYVRDEREAFDKYLSRGRPGYVERARFSPAEAVALIREAGGVPVLAHPGGRGHALVVELMAEDLQGIEVYHPDHGPEAIVELLRLAADYDLVVTGGSDFHARGAACGSAIGEVTVPGEVVAALRRRLPP